MQLRHIRGDKELPALVDDANYDVNYQEYRQFQKPVNVLPVSTFRALFCLTQQVGVFFSFFSTTNKKAGAP